MDKNLKNKKQKVVKEKKKNSVPTIGKTGKKKNENLKQKDNQTTEEKKDEEQPQIKDNKVKYYTEIDEPPLIIMVQGGHSSGKTTLIKSLVKYYTNQNITSFKGSITVRNSKNQRLTFIECPNDISSLDDCSKIVDVAIY